MSQGKPLQKKFACKEIPVIRGVQAGKEYYTAMCTLDFVSKNFHFPPIGIPEEKIIQRKYNKARIPKIASYLVKYANDYILPPIIISIDGTVEFHPLTELVDNQQIGVLRISEMANFFINDGQHRCGAIKQAVHQKESLKRETLPVVFYVDKGIKKARQMFSDLNGHPVRPNQNINITFDSREFINELTRALIAELPLFSERVEMFLASCAKGSSKIFTITSIANANRVLVTGLTDALEAKSICLEFWNVLQQALPELNDLVKSKNNLSAKHIKENYFYVYAIALQSIAVVAAELRKSDPDNWKNRLGKISKINWKRDNSEWEGRAMSGGKLTTGANHPTLTINLIKIRLGLPLNASEQKVEKQFKRTNV